MNLTIALFVLRITLYCFHSRVISHFGNHILSNYIMKLHSFVNKTKILLVFVCVLLSFMALLEITVLSYMKLHSFVNKT